MTKPMVARRGTPEKLEVPYLGEIQVDPEGVGSLGPVLTRVYNADPSDPTFFSKLIIKDI